MAKWSTNPLKRLLLGKIDYVLTVSVYAAVSLYLIYMADFSKLFLMQCGVLSAMSVLSSCIYDSQPECRDEKVEFSIVNDWENSPGANPEGMAYLFFRDGVAYLWRFDFPGKKAGTVALPSGEYAFVMYNNDTDDVIFGKDSEGMPVAIADPDMTCHEACDVNIYESPDMIWSDAIRRVIVDKCGVRYSNDSGMAGGAGVFSLRTYPVQVTPSVTVRVLHVDNLAGVVDMDGMLSGVASGINLYSGIKTGNAVESFHPLADSASSVVARFNIFGVSPDEDCGNVLYMNFYMSDGRVICKDYDVSDDLIDALNPLDIEIVIDSITLPEAPPAAEGGGFNPYVDGWTTVVVNYTTP